MEEIVLHNRSKAVCIEIQTPKHSAYCLQPLDHNPLTACNFAGNHSETEIEASLQVTEHGEVSTEDADWLRNELM